MCRHVSQYVCMYVCMYGMHVCVYGCMSVLYVCYDLFLDFSHDFCLEGENSITVIVVQIYCHRVAYTHLDTNNRLVVWSRSIGTQRHTTSAYEQSWVLYIENRERARARDSLV